MASILDPGFDPAAATYWRITGDLMIVTGPEDPAPEGGVEVPFDEARQWLQAALGSLLPPSFYGAPLAAPSNQPLFQFGDQSTGIDA